MSDFLFFIFLLCSTFQLQGRGCSIVWRYSVGKRERQKKNVDQRKLECCMGQMRWRKGIQILQGISLVRSDEEGDRNDASSHCLGWVVQFIFHCHHGWLQLSSETSLQIETFRTSSRHLYLSFRFVLLINEQNNILFIVSNLCMIAPTFVQFAYSTCINIHWLHQSKLATVSSNSGNSGCTLALWEMPKWNIILEYNVIVYSG